MNKSDLIFILDDDVKYGNLILSHLKRNGFNNIELYSRELDALANFENSPRVFICDFHLNTMSGLQLLKRAKEISPDTFNILLSGEFHENGTNFDDERFANIVDHYLIKDMNELTELQEVLDLKVE
jgi:DNA-binding NtrC family response regulator